MHGLEERLYDLATRDDPRGIGYVLMRTDTWAVGDERRLAVRDRLVDLLITGEPLLVKGKPLITLLRLEALLDRRPPTVLLQPHVAQVTVGLRHSQEEVEIAIVQAQKARPSRDSPPWWGVPVAVPLDGTRVGLRRALRSLWPEVTEHQTRILKWLGGVGTQRRYEVVNPEGEWAFRHLILRETWTEIARATTPGRATGKTRSYHSVQATVTRFWRRRGIRRYREHLWSALSDDFVARQPEAERSRRFLSPGRAGPRDT